MDFKERLEAYRLSLGLDKSSMANRLGISASLYSLLENGSRTPSKKVMISLVADSGKSDKYWLEGMSDDEYRKSRAITKGTQMVLELIEENNLLENIDIRDLFKGYTAKNKVEELLIQGLLADISYLKSVQNINKLIDKA